ncbi:MAG: phosphotransferase [Pseudomonadota bacterium]
MPKAELKKKDVRHWLSLWFPDVKIDHWQQLGDGVTSRVYGVEYRAGGRRDRTALRLTDTPLELCWRESLLLNTLHAAELPVTACHGVKREGSTTGMLLDWLPGKPVSRPIDYVAYAEQAAELLARIHGTPIPQRMRRFETGFSKRVAALRSQFPQYAAVAEALSRGMPPGQDKVLLHGDFWPGNLLFKRKELVGVVDWSDAAAGCPLADVSNARFEIRWLWGEAAMHAFTVHYFANAPYHAQDLAQWDLVALLSPILGMHRWNLTDAHERRVLQAVNKMADEALKTVVR